MREKYESLSLVVLRDLAKARGLKNISSMKKSDLVNRMLEEDARKQKETESMQTQEERGERVKAKKRAQSVRKIMHSRKNIPEKDGICTKGTRNRCRSSDKRKGRRAGRNTGKIRRHLQRQMIP